MALPELVAQNNFETTWSAASFLITAHKATTQNRFDAEDIKKLATYFFCADAFSPPFADEREQSIAVDRHAREAAVLVPEIEKIWIAKGCEFFRSSLGEVNSTEGHELLRHCEQIGRASCR